MTWNDERVCRLVWPEVGGGEEEGGEAYKAYIGKNVEKAGIKIKSIFSDVNIDGRNGKIT